MLLLYHSPESVWPLRLVYVHARLMTERITTFRISLQVADKTFLVGDLGFKPRTYGTQNRRAIRLHQSPIDATHYCVIIYQLIAYMIAVCAAI